MPVLRSPQFATQFQEKWLRLHPEDEDNASGSVHLDDSLTSLHWLQDFSIPGASLERPPSTTTPRVPGGEDYSANPQVKPPYSYAALIYMAMQASQETKITLSAIYSWITDNFSYFRHAEPSWQNSIRYHLSVNKYFRKVPRDKDKPGKGGFWQIDPQYADTLVNGVFNQRQMRARFGSQKRSRTSPSPVSSYSSIGFTQHNEHQPGFCHLETDQGPHVRVSLGNAPKPPPPKQSSMVARNMDEQLLVPEGKELEREDRGDFDWSAVVDDLFGGRFDIFEDFDISAFQSLLQSELDLPLQGQSVAAVEKWSGSWPEKTCGWYTEAGGTGAVVSGNPLPQQCTPLFPQHHDQLTMFMEPLQHSWEELKDDVQTDRVDSGSWTSCL